VGGGAALRVVFLVRGLGLVFFREAAVFTFALGVFFEPEEVFLVLVFVFAMATLTWISRCGSLRALEWIS
jgi:hypothetical protein